MWDLLSWFNHVRRKYLYSLYMHDINNHIYCNPAKQHKLFVFQSEPSAICKESSVDHLKGLPQMMDDARILCSMQSC